MTSWHPLEQGLDKKQKSSFNLPAELVSPSVIFSFEVPVVVRSTFGLDERFTIFRSMLNMRPVFYDALLN